MQAGATDRGSSPEVPRFEIRVERGAARSRVIVSGEIDVATAGEFERTVREELAVAPVCLDLAALSFMDSSGVRALDALLRDPPPGAHGFVIAPALQDGVRQILEMTGMLGVLPFEPPVEGGRP